jgi:hypothetical protein
MSDPVFRGYTIFCDDIRHEADGKITYVGCYSGIMYVHADFPFVVPKFGLSITYMEMKGAYDGDVILRAYFPGDTDKPSLEAALDLQKVRNAPLSPNPDPSEQPLYSAFNTNIILSPLVLSGEGLIKVRIQCGDELLKLGSLRIIKAPT